MLEDNHETIKFFNSTTESFFPRLDCLGQWLAVGDTIIDPVWSLAGRQIIVGTVDSPVLPDLA